MFLQMILHFAGWLLARAVMRATGSENTDDEDADPAFIRRRRLF